MAMRTYATGAILDPRRWNRSTWRVSEKEGREETTLSYEPEAARGTDRKEKRRRGRAYQGRWREGDRDAMLGRSQSPEELPPLGRSPSVQGRAVFLSWARREIAHNWLFYYPGSTQLWVLSWAQTRPEVDMGSARNCAG
jgi:hypothetical protein